MQNEDATSEHEVALENYDYTLRLQVQEILDKTLEVKYCSNAKSKYRNRKRTRANDRQRA